MAKLVRILCGLQVKRCPKQYWHWRIACEKSSNVSVLWPCFLTAGRSFGFVLEVFPLCLTSWVRAVIEAYRGPSDKSGVRSSRSLSYLLGEPNSQESFF